MDTRHRHADRRGFVAMMARAARSSALLLLLLTLQAAGQSGGEFEIARSTIDNGGGKSTAGDFSLIGAIGQPDADAAAPSGREFEIRTGFFGAASSTTEQDREILFSNGFEG